MMDENTEKNSELDEYGVWVKKAPENAQTEKPQTEDLKLPDFSFLDQQAEETPEPQETSVDEAEVQESDSKPLDLPDFENDNVNMEETGSEFANIDFSNIADIQEPKAEELAESGEFDLPDLDETQAVEDSTQIQETEVKPEEVEESVADMEETQEEVNPDSFMHNEIPDGEIDLDSFMSDDAPAKSEIPDGEVDLDSFMSDSPAPGEDGDVDLSSFLGDEAATFNDGDIDLESFMGGESFTSEKEEMEEIEEQEPLDIELDFENVEYDEQEEDEDEGVSEEEFEEMFQDAQDNAENSESVDLDSFMSDEAPRSTEAAGSEDIDLSDFGFEDNAENQNPILDEETEKKKHETEVVDYEMNIDDEETETKIEETTDSSESNAEEEIVVDISQDEEVAEQKEQETDLSSPDDSFDIDSIFDSIEDESGNTVSFNEVPTNEEIAKKNELSGPEDLSLSVDDGISFPSPEEPAETSVEQEAVQSQEDVETASFDEFQEPAADESNQIVMEDKADDEPVIEEENFEIEEEPDTTNIDQTLPEDIVTEEITDSVQDEITDSEDDFTLDAMDNQDSENYDIPEALDETEEQETTQDEESNMEEFSIDDFMGEEGFTDGGIGVTGPYNEDGTLIEKYIKKDEEEPSQEPEEETHIEESDQDITSEFEEPAMENKTADEAFEFEEPAVESTETSSDAFESAEVPETNSIENESTQEFSMDEPVIEENVVEETEIIDESELQQIDSTPMDSEVNMEETAVDSSDFTFEEPTDSLGFQAASSDQDLGSEDFDLTGNTQDKAQEEDFNESEITEPFVEETEVNETEVDESEVNETEVEESEITETENNTDIPEESLQGEEENKVNEEPELADVSAYLDKGPDYDMEGVTVTLDDFEKLASQPVVEPQKEEEIPDTFDEEAASLADSDDCEEEKQVYSVFAKTQNSVNNIIVENEKIESEASETMEEPVSENDTSTEEGDDMNNEILEKIAEELSTLKTEINGLKSEFENIKKNGISAKEDTADSVQKDSGFFNNEDEDDTIALSGDELSNILSSAEFTSQDGDEIVQEQESNSELSMDFNNEKLEEPVFEEEAESEEITENEEDEISVPKVDDLVVESSSTDLMENPVADEEPAEEPVITEIEQNEAIPTDDDIPSPTLESLDLPSDLDTAETLTEDNIDYLTEDQSILQEDEEALETGISEEPVENVFTNWEASEEESSDTETEKPAMEEAPAEEMAEAEEPAMENIEVEETPAPVPEEVSSEESAPAAATESSSDIPAEMKEEIKAVLSYMDQLLENLPEEKIAEFAQSEQFETYKKLFAELGLS